MARISIHALREEGDGHSPAAWSCACISIHALREEGDSRALFYGAFIARFLSTPSARRATAAIMEYNKKLAAISIHALREEGDVLDAAEKSGQTQFLSTPSARRATF